MMFLLDKLINSIESGEIVAGVYLDFPNAFHTVDHDIILTKMWHYGIRSKTLQWFKITCVKYKIVRMISRSGFIDHTDPLFTNLVLIKFVDRNKYLIGRFLFRY